MNGVRAGEVIAGKFQIERVLGEGGMGVVVAARHLQLGQMVALKFMRDEVCTPDYKSRFLREARNTVRLKSKHVSRVLDVGALDGGAPYMVMEYLEGTDLSELLQRRGAFSAAEACDYVIQACEAIAEAHAHGIVHRDLKPANLFLTKGSGGEPVVKVLDFGVSKLLDLGVDGDTVALGDAQSLEPESVVTKASDLLGSPGYMAPEQVVSARDADERSDVWSLGVILYRLISGKAPFGGGTLGELIQGIMHSPVPSLRAVRPDIPPGLEHVVARCLERDRARRLADVTELARLLAPYATPTATPSLERIALLGPALVTAPSVPPPRTPHTTNPSLSNGRAAWTSAPPSGAPGPPTAATSPFVSNLIWAGLFVVVVGVGYLAVVRMTTPSARAAVVEPPPVASVAVSAPVLEPVTATASPPVATVIAPKPTVAVASAVVTPSAPPSHTSHKPRPKPSGTTKTGPAPTHGGIPATRE